MLSALIERSLPLLHDSNNGLHDNKSLADGMHSLQYPISRAKDVTDGIKPCLCNLSLCIVIFIRCRRPICIKIKCNTDNLFAPAGLPSFLQTLRLYKSRLKVIDSVYISSGIFWQSHAVNQCFMVCVLIPTFWKIGVIKLLMFLVLKSNVSFLALFCS